MTSRVAATRYAKALFDVALAERQDLELIAQELSDIVALMSGNDELARALTHPAIPRLASAPSWKRCCRAARSTCCCRGRC